MNTCEICLRIEKIKKHTNPFFITELETGYVLLADHQTYRGYTIFISKLHVSELHLLEMNTRTLFLTEMAKVAAVIFKAFKPDKLNYELLGNTHAHLHWHIIPRSKDEDNADEPIWAVPEELRSYKPNDDDLKYLKETITTQLSKQNYKW